jgi:hypothetical protein
MGTLITVTDAGRAALVARGHEGTNTHKIVEIGLATAPFVANEELETLPSELKRIATFGGTNVAPDTIHVTLKDDTADQYTLYGFGLYLENGVLLAVYSQPEPILEKSPVAILLLSADLQFAAIDAAKLVFGDASFANPPASTDRQGVIELATQAEVDAGTDELRAVTPKTAAMRYAALSGAVFSGQVEVPTPPAGDHSDRAASTAFVTTAMMQAHVGQIVFEPRVSVRPGYLKCNGAVVDRSDYPVLWAYAEASGALVSEADWQEGQWGCFSMGDGETSFRLPELRGEFIRCWADGREDIDPTRSIGSQQRGQNLSHSHDASSSEAGDHAHSGWTSQEGMHQHGGTTLAAGTHNHTQGNYTRLLRPPYPGSLTGSDATGSGSELAVGPGDSADIVAAGNHEHWLTTSVTEAHAHAVGMSAAGHHTHGIAISVDGGTESRPRNIALLAMIRAY